ncbi:MAG: hypothetical protein J6562_05815 [Candidatus Schmidhempelia sp.]|jgi:hypothetical protein|nr:hypothetical protein [Candidatus Schmidhempelia sp.]
MNRNIIIQEQDFDVLRSKINYISAIAELLISDNGRSEWADETLLNSIGAISTMSYEISTLIGKAVIA